MKKYGYVRVSTKDQNIGRQMVALKEKGLKDHEIYIDMMSGNTFDKPQYIKLIKKMKEGDTLIIKSIDRLGRNYMDIQEQWRMLVKTKQIDIMVLDMPLLDTANQTNDLIRTFICDIVLQLLSFVAENERSEIKKRQAEGIAVAKAKGIRFGRPPKTRNKVFYILKERWEGGEISSRDACQKLKVSHTTFLRWVQEERKNN